MSDFGNETRPVADKSHKCIWCVERIAPGTKHMRYVGIWEGDWQNWRMHVECLEAHERGEESWDETICNNRHLRGFSCREMDHVRRERDARKILEKVYGVLV